MLARSCKMTGPDQAEMDAEQLYKVINVINHLAVELDVDLALDSMRRGVLELLECEKVTLFLISESLQELRGKISDGVGDSVIAVKYGEGIAGTVAQCGGLMNIADAYSHPLFNPEVDKRLQYRTRSILCCSIADTAGSNVAVLQALNKRSGAFTPADEHMLQLFGVHLGNILTKSRYFEEAKREKARLATLSHCFKQLSAVTTLNGALDTIAAAACELIFARHVVVLLVDQARQTLWTSIVDKQSINGASLSFRVKEGQGMLAQCAVDKQQVTMCLTHQAHIDPKLLELFEMLGRGHSNLNEVLLQPVVDQSGDKCLALLCALNKQERCDSCSSLLYEHSFTPTDCEALNLFSMEVADVLSARSLEISFASAMSVVDTQDATAAQEQISSMLKAQLLDYAPQQGSVDALSRDNSCQLQHSTTMPAGGIRAGSCSGLTGVDDTFSRNLRKSSSIAASGSTSSGTPAFSPVSTMRPSFHHHMPHWAEIKSASSTASTRAKYTSWELDCSSMSTEELVHMAYDLFMLTGVLDELQLPDSDLDGFLNAVASHYHDEVPYHNLTHAAQVLHTVWMVFETTSIRNVLSSGEELILLIAALCHDLDHDGFTNSFHIHLQSDLAQRYNDQSVQEHHHCALTSHILRQHGSNLLQCFTGPDWHQARRRLVAAILGTDMHHHFALTQEVQKHSPTYTCEEEADKLLLMKAVLHAADISNPTRPFAAALAAAERVHLEFQRQVVREKELGLPVAPHMETDEPAAWAQMEVQFIDYVAGPLWGRLAQVFPTLQEPINAMRMNRARFAAMAGSSPTLATPRSEEQEPVLTSTSLFGSNSRRSNNTAAVIVLSGDSSSTPATNAAAAAAAFDDGSHTITSVDKQP